MAQQVEKESNRLITKQGWNDAQTVLTVEYFDGGLRRGILRIVPPRRVHRAWGRQSDPQPHSKMGAR